MKPKPLDIDILRSSLSYDKNTGVLTRLTGRMGSVAGSVGARGYVYVKVNGRHVLAHRAAWAIVTGDDPQEFIDHQDTCRSNNRWENLRLASRSENGANSQTQKRNPLGLKGVRKKARCERWRAEIRVGGELRYLGCFRSPQEAHTAYRHAAEAHFGSFARP